MVEQCHPICVLHYASMNNREECIRILLDYGSNPYEPDNEGRTSYDMAMPNTKVFIDKYLFKKKHD
jgi:ankyrin repeat protein